MGESSKIEWTHATFNPWRGCAKVHTGCLHCYAEVNQGVKMQGIDWGEVWQGAERVVKADGGWKAPKSWMKKAAVLGQRHRVFCGSLCDVLEVPALPDRWPSAWSAQQRLEAMDRVDRNARALAGARARLWDIIRVTAVDAPRVESGGAVAAIRSGRPGLDWMLLTKRPEHWKLVPEDVRPLVWFGTSISDQATANRGLAELANAKGFRFKFASWEPATGPIDYSAFFGGPYVGLPGDRVVDGYNYAGLDLLIMGGESGTDARECNAEWFADGIEQCRAAGVAPFVKQLGARAVLTCSVCRGDGALAADDPAWATKATRCETCAGRGVGSMGLTSPKGGNPKEWPTALQVREWPAGVL